MIGKKINQLATELAPDSTDLTIIGDPISGVSKKITLAQLGAIFSGAVSFYTNLAAFPITGDINVIYCAKDTQKLYLWSGSAYVEVFPSQALLNTYQLRSEKGVSNGYASLDAAGKVPISQLPSSIMEYKGTWNAATNTPTLANGTGDTGDVYICNVAGTVNFGAGPLTFAVGDYVIYSGTIWQRSSGAVGTVTSVAASITGNSIGITGSPITTSGTLALAFAGTSAQYVNGAGNLITFPSIISEAQNLITEVYNKSGATITKGTVVYINGGQGNLPSIAKALATGDATSAQTYGIVQADITNMNNGYVVAAGRLGDLDTQAFTEGTQLYLSPTTAGTYQSTKPYAPQHLVYVAIVVRAHPTQGVIEVKIQNGYEMDELHNVSAQSPSNGDILQYVTSTSLWTKVAGSTTNIAEGTNLYYTEARVNANTNVAANTAARHNAVTIGTANGLSLSTQVLSLALASGSTTGALSSTDWTTFNSKQNALTNPVTGTGVSGQVTYFNGTSTVTGTNNHFWDATNNRLGIGTTTPQRSIEIFNATADNHLRLSGNAPSVSMGEAVTGSIYQAKFGLVTVNGQFVTAGVAGDFVIISQTGATIIGTSSTEKMRVQSSGNVSINNTNDTYKFDVTGTARFTGQLRLESTITDGTNTYTLPSATGTLALTSALSGMITGSGTTNYLPKFTGASTIGNSVMQEASGNIGIGTSPISPANSYKYLHIEGGNSTSGGVLYLSTSGNGNSSQIYTDTTGLNINTNTSLPIIFNPAGTERMRLNASGNLSIGNTNDSFKLDVSGTGRFTDALIVNNNASVIRSGSSLTTLGQSRYLNLNDYFGNTNARMEIGLGYSSATGITNVPAIIGYLQTSTTDFTKGDLYFATRDVTTDTAPTVRLTIASTGAATFSSNVIVGGGTASTSKLTVLATTGVSGLGSPTIGIYDASNTVFGFDFSLEGVATGNLFLNRLVSGTRTSVLEIARATGAATFSSSVTAGGVITANGGGIDGTATEAILFSNVSYPNVQKNRIRSSISGGVNGNLLIFETSTSVTGNFNTNQLVLRGDGNVGIGTTSPVSLLNIYGDTNLIQLQNSTTGSGTADGTRINLSGNDLQIINRESANMIFYTADTERMRITSGGNVLVGQTSPDGGANGIYLRPGTESGFIATDVNAIKLNRLGSTGEILTFFQASTQVGSVSVTGSLTSYNVTSDYRLKTDFKDYSGLDLVNKIKTYDYEWKADKSRGYGVIAHELQSVINYAVTGVKDGKDMQGVDYSKIVPVLIKSIQELKAELDTLKNK